MGISEFWFGILMNKNESEVESVRVMEIWRLYREFRNYVQEISFLLFLVESQVRTPTHPFLESGDLMIVWFEV